MDLTLCHCLYMVDIIRIVLFYLYNKSYDYLYLMMIIFFIIISDLSSEYSFDINYIYY